MHAVEDLVGERQVAREETDVAQVELGVGDRFVVSPLPRSFAPAAVELTRAIQISALDVEPPERVQIAGRVVLVADLFGERRRTRLPIP